MITVTLTRSQLVRAGACQGGLQYFDQKAKGKKALTLRWTVRDQIRYAKAVPSFYSWLRDKGMIPQLSMSGLDLRGADLRGADLRGAYLSGAYLSGAYLSGADLRGANLGDWERGPDGYARKVPA